MMAYLRNYKVSYIDTLTFKNEKVKVHYLWKHDLDRRSILSYGSKDTEDWIFNFNLNIQNRSIMCNYETA